MPNVMEPIDTCQKCGGPVWDNRVDKKNPKGPDFKCKDKDCGEGFWLGEAKGGKVQPKVRASSVITVGMLAEKMSEAHEALQPFFGALDTDKGITLDTLYKMAFTELKGKVG